MLIIKFFFSVNFYIINGVRVVFILNAWYRVNFVPKCILAGTFRIHWIFRVSLFLGNAERNRCTTPCPQQPLSHQRLLWSSASFHGSNFKCTTLSAQQPTFPTVLTLLSYIHIHVFACICVHPSFFVFVFLISLYICILVVVGIQLAVDE